VSKQAAGTLRLAWRMLVRDWRAGELTVLGLAVVLAVAALTSVSFLADRVQQGLILQSHQLLGGDLLLAADHPWNGDVGAEAKRRGLRVAQSVTFPSMVMGPSGAALAEVKAVSDNYPLRGTLRIAPTLDAVDAETHAVPVPGSAWLEDRLARQVAPKAGALLHLGRLALTASAVLTRDPARGVNVFAVAPLLMINVADLPATGLIQPGSRARWHLHIAGEQRAVDAFRRWIEPRLGRGQRLESVDNARPEMRTLLERAGRFLRLAALLTVVLCAVATGLAADRYLRRHLDGCAVMRCLGARQRQLLIIHGGEFILCGALATLAGSVLGFAAQWGFQAMLSGLLSQDLPLPSWRPWAHGIAVGLTLVIGFVLPPLLRLRRVPAMRVLRREWQASEPTLPAAYGFGASLLALLMLSIAGEARLGLIVLAGFAGAVLVYGGAAWLLIRRLGHLRGAWRPWRLGLANLRRRWRGTIAQAVALALGLTALLLLSVTRDDLLASWRSKVPADAPNRFVINLQPEERAAFAEFMVAHGLTAPAVEPMVRGRLVAVNGRSVGPGSYADERAQHLVEREFNLSWTNRLPPENTVSAGRWYGDSHAAQFSVEQGLADTLGLKVGDQLTYEVAGVPFSARITSVRKLDWDSMRVNFFVIVPPGVLDGYAVSYITSFHLPDGQAGLVTDLVRAFPNLTVIDVTAVLRQLQDSFDQVARAVQALFGFALAAGLVVLYAALQASSDERLRELAVMRALGARGRQLRAALLVEFAVLGALSGLLAGLGAAAIGYVLARYALHLPYQPTPSLLLIGVAAGVVGVAAAGLSATRGILRRAIAPDLLAY
jgi:putative ABC transport system permease protein